MSSQHPLHNLNTVKSGRVLMMSHITGSSDPPARNGQKSVNCSVNNTLQYVKWLTPPVHTVSASVIQSPTEAPDETFCSATRRITLSQIMRKSHTASFLRWSPSEAPLTVSSVNTRHSSKKLIIIKSIYGNITALRLLHMCIYMYTYISTQLLLKLNTPLIPTTSYS